MSRANFNILHAASIGFFVAMLAPTAQAALDPEAKKPYQLQMVLHIGSNRVFTPLFQEQLQRELANHLKMAFGDLARIDVTRTHRLLPEIETKGLDQALAGFDTLSDQTTHFVLLDYAAGVYQIHTRFQDGLTGQTGPATQRTHTNDRAAVAAAIARLIEASFSPAGTVTQLGKDVTLTLKGGALGVPLHRWIQRGNVFAVSRIISDGERQRSVRLEWAVLEVLDVPQPGLCRCRYLHRYQEDALRENPGTLGYRALRIHSTRGLVKVQLLDDATLQPLDGVRVRVLQPGSSKPAELITNRDGLAITRDAFAHLALVQVLSGETVRAQLPIAVIENRTVVARVKIQADAESTAPLEVRRDAWLRRAYDNVRLVSERSLDLALQLNQSLEAALASGRKSLPLFEDELKYLERERAELQQLAKEKKRTFNLSEGDQQIDELRKQTKTLQAFVERLEVALKDSGDEKTLGLTKLLERARLLEAQAEFEPAIRLYEQVVQASPDQAGKVRVHLDKLKAAWAIKGDKHVEARKFVYQTWPTLGVAELQKNLDRAKAALAACREADDTLTPQKLLRGNVTHTANLQKQLDALTGRDGEDERNRKKALGAVSEGLLRLHNEAATFVATRKQ